MDSKNSFINKLYQPLYLVGLFLLVALAVISAVRPAQNIFEGITNVIFAALLPALFFFGRSAKKSYKIQDVLYLIGIVVGVIVFVSMITTWINYGFFHALLYKNTPIYYLNGTPYDVTKEVIFFSGLQFQEVSVNYAGAFGLIAAAYLPGSFFIERKQNKTKFLITLSVGVVGLLSLLTVPNFKAVIVLAIVSGFALIYKFYWQNKKVIKAIKYVLLALFALALIFYLVSGINVLVGRKFTGFFDKLFASNPIMNKATQVMEVDGVYKNLFGLSFVKVVTSDIKLIVQLETGIFEVELLKEVGSIGVIISLLFILVSFISFDKYLETSDDDDFSKVTIVMFFATTFIYNSLFYSSGARIMTGEYNFVLRFVPFLIAIFLLGMTYFSQNKTKEGQKHEA